MLWFYTLVKKMYSNVPNPVLYVAMEIWGALFANLSPCLCLSN